MFWNYPVTVQFKFTDSCFGLCSNIYYDINMKPNVQSSIITLNMTQTGCYDGAESCKCVSQWMWAGDEQMNVCWVSAEQFVEIQSLGFSTRKQPEPTSDSLRPSCVHLSLEKEADWPSALIRRPGRPDRPEKHEELTAWQARAERGSQEVKWIKSIAVKVI